MDCCKSKPSHLTARKRFRVTGHLLFRQNKRKQRIRVSFSATTPQAVYSVAKKIQHDIIKTQHLLVRSTNAIGFFFSSWYHEFGSHLQPIYASPRFEPLQDILLIRKVRLEDNGRWTCKVSNHFGEQSLDVHVTVTSHLVVHVLPQLQVINNFFEITTYYYCVAFKS